MSNASAQAPQQPMFTVPMPQWHKPESTLGNILEFFLTYGLGLLYAAVNLFLVFGPFEFTSPEAKAAFWPPYIYGSLFYLGVQFYAGVVGTQARFTASFRLLKDSLASSANFILPAAVFLLGVIGKTFTPQGVDLDVTVVSTGFTLLDVFGIGLIVYVAIRRVEERYADK